MKQVPKQAGKAVEDTENQPVAEKSVKQNKEYKVALYNNDSDKTVLTNRGELKQLEKDNCHLELSVMKPGREPSFVKDLEVDITLIKGTGEQFGPYRMELLCNPLNQHYGLNIDIPGGEYIAKVEIRPENPHEKHKPERTEIRFRDIKL